MGNFNQVKNAVKMVLTIKPETRNDDFKLINEVLNYYIDTENTTLADLARNHGGVPSLETITRWRRKLQLIYADLRAEKKVQEYRKEQEKEIRKELGYES